MKRKKPTIIIKETEVVMKPGKRSSKLQTSYSPDGIPTIVYPPSRKKISCMNFSAYEKRKYAGSIIYEKSKGTISFLWVAPEHRKKGIGSLLIKKIERLAKRDGKRKLVLSVRESNPRARRLYVDQGFEQTKKKNVKWHGKSISYITMTKQLK
jgi:ribosomal protein S18 acetylase RimI-like enzyme